LSDFLASSDVAQVRRKIKKETMNIYLGGDHGGFEVKKKIAEWLTNQGYQVEDCGAFKFDADDDYPDFTFPVAQKVAYDQSGLSRGIVFCRSGAGVVIAANKVHGIRAIRAHDAKSAEHGRRDNDANVLGLAGDWMTEAEMQATILAFLTTPFDGAERHRRRLQKIADYEKKENQ
jgi:ribose 5-phosphate isomerase B